MASGFRPQMDRRQLLKAAVGAGLVIPGLPLLWRFAGARSI
jgi:hypothetical protein